MNISQQFKSDLPVLIFCALIVFIRLGTGEIQPGDEGTTGLKAATVSEYFSDDADSPEFIDDKTNAPAFLNTVITALFFYIFGESAFVLRLFSALCSVGAVFILYFISRRVLSRELAVITSVLLSASLVWNEASRLAGPETAVAFFTLVALLAIVKAYESDKKNRILLWSALFVLVSLLLLTVKPILSVLPLILCLIFSFNNNNKTAGKYLKITSIIILLLIISSLILSLSTGAANIIIWGLEDTGAGQYNFDILNLNHYNNILIISNPFFIFSFAFIVLPLVFTRKYVVFMKEQQSKYIMRVMIAWFFIISLFLFFASFQSPRYAVYYIAPMVIMAVWFYDKLPRFDFSIRLKWIITALFLSVLVFTFMNGMRPGSAYIVMSGAPAAIKWTYGIVLLLLLLSVFLPKKILGKMTGRTLMNSWKYLPYLLLFKAVGINFMVPAGNSFGAAETAQVIKEFGNSNIVYMHHGEKEDGFTNSQLAWYLYKSIENWTKKDLTSVPLGENRIDYRSLAEADRIPDLMLVYYIREKTDLTDRVVEELKKTRPLLLATPNYLLFGMKRKEKPIDVLALE